MNFELYLRLLNEARALMAAGTLTAETLNAMRKQSMDAVGNDAQLEEAWVYLAQDWAGNGAPQVVEKEEDDPKDPAEDPVIPVPQLTAHQIDIPEEPEEVEVFARQWNPATFQFETKSLGKMLLVPTGCEEPTPVSPYANTVTLRSALPRDKQLDANLYAAYQSNAWVSRAWVQANLDEDINPVEVDKQLADDIPFILQVQGKPDPSASGVAQTAGMQPGISPGAGGSNNGAPLPPGPGPGRGNKIAPGDGLAKTP